jgi:hypothetical protein
MEKSLFGNFTQPEPCFVAFSSFFETKVCGSKAQPVLSFFLNEEQLVLILIFSFYLFINTKFCMVQFSKYYHIRIGFLVEICMQTTPC